MHRSFERISIEENDDGSISFDVTPFVKAEKGKDHIHSFELGKSGTAPNLESAFSKLKQIVKSTKGKNGKNAETEMNRFFNGGEE